MSGQTWDPERYARNARFVSDLGMPVVELLDPKPGERILDLGCGDGALTEKLVALGCIVVGVDGSADQVEAACARGLDARVVRAEQLEFDGEFDAVLSNAVLHWVKDADAAIDGVWRALRPNGRFVGERRPSLRRPDPHRMPGARASRARPDCVTTRGTFPTARLRRAASARGLRDRAHRALPAPTPCRDVTGWLETFGESFLRAVARR